MPAPAPAPAGGPSTGAPAARPPSLLPREHGAWGQLAFPLVSGLALGRPGLPALLLAAAIVLAFLAHEPLLVVLGQRGRRVEAGLGRRARRALAAALLAALAAGAAGLALAGPPARLAVLPAATLGAAAVALAAARLERTLPGELLVAAALATCAAPVALAAGAPPQWAWSAAATWLAAFASATLPVRAILLRARTKGEVDRRPLAAMAVAVIAGAALAAASHGWLAWQASLALLPVALTALALTALPVRPQRLDAVGWSIVGASLATLGGLVLGLRLA